MKRIIIRRSDLGDLPAIIFYKQFAIAGEDGQVHLYQVLKRGDGTYDSLHSDFLGEDIQYKSLVTLTNALLHTTLWNVLIDDRSLFITYDKFQILGKKQNILKGILTMQINRHTVGTNVASLGTITNEERFEDMTNRVNP